jgi:hypothetical protein
MENLIKRLENVGFELNRKFGTESYEIRCELHDIREALEKLHKSDDNDKLCHRTKFTDKDFKYFSNKMSKLYNSVIPKHLREEYEINKKF